MARIVILGAGIGGVPMAFEMKEMVGKKHDVTVISDTPTFHFVPSNPWIPPKWRKPEDLKIELAPRRVLNSFKNQQKKLIRLIIKFN